MRMSLKALSALQKQGWGWGEVILRIFIPMFLSDFVHTSTVTSVALFLIHTHTHTNLYRANQADMS